MPSAHELVESCATVFTLPEICGCVRKVAGDSHSTTDDLANVLRRSRRSTTSPARLAGTHTHLQDRRALAHPPPWRRSLSGHTRA